MKISVVYPVKSAEEKDATNNEGQEEDRSYKSPAISLILWAMSSQLRLFYTTFPSFLKAE
jgi:hypothetical protein